MLTMAENEATPLTDDEREELEALRAEKARREDEARARAEREELERLRAEQEREDAKILAERAAAQRAAEAAAPVPHAPAQAAAAPAPAQAAAAPAPAPEQKAVVDPEHLTFGQKMVGAGADPDDPDAGMPPAQIIIIVIAVIAVIAMGVYIATH